MRTNALKLSADNTNVLLVIKDQGISLSKWIIHLLKEQVHGFDVLLKLDFQMERQISSHAVPFTSCDSSQKGRLYILLFRH